VVSTARWRWSTAVALASGALSRSVFCFFFQAEDGIRDSSVTGVQTCALPILDGTAGPVAVSPDLAEIYQLEMWLNPAGFLKAAKIGRASCRKECRSRWGPDQ